MNKHTTQSGMTLIELTVVLLILVAMAGLVVPYMTGTSSKALCDATDLSMQNLKKIIMDRYYLDTLGYYPKNTKDTTANYNLKYLLVKPDGWDAYDPETAVGWRGPYVMNGTKNYFPVDGDAGDIDGVGDINNLTDELHVSFRDTTNNKVHDAVLINDLVVLDGWGRPIILQVPSDADCSSSSLSTKPGGCARLVSAGPIPGRNIQFNGIDATINNARADDRGNDRVLFLQIPDPVDPRSGGNKPCDEY